jgi:RimJ/RimL family protein N-acetyltransferase
MEIKLVDYTADYLELSWKWLNDPEIKALTNTPDFSPDQQVEWFNSLASKQDYFIKGIEFSNSKIGVCGLKNITQSDAEYWGYIGDKQYWRKGIGTLILLEMEKKAKELGVKTVWLNVLINNANAIQLYSKNGYLVESVNERTQKMRKTI